MRASAFGTRLRASFARVGGTARASEARRGRGARWARAARAVGEEFKGVDLDDEDVDASFVPRFGALE